MSQQPNQCRDCNFFVVTNGDKAMGECHCYPPKVMLFNEKIANLYPRVNENSVACTEFVLYEGD